MNRRDALKRISTVLGAAVSVPVASAIMSGCRSEGGAGYVMQALTDGRDELVATIAEAIIPATDTPGARAAGVHEFIDILLAEWFPQAQRDRFLAGLEHVEELAQSEHGQEFAEIEPEAQHELLAGLDEEAIGARENGSGDERPFFSMMKELTLVGYYTSEVGATQELQWLAAPGRYEGNIPTEEVGRAWA